MASESYSFSPQFATIRSESPLAGMRPVASIQHTALSFREDKPFQIRSAGEELVGLGAIEGVSKGAGAALEGITTAYVKKREREEKKDDEALKYLRDVHLAQIKATPTEEEKLIKQARLSLLGQQVQAATAKNEDLKEKEDTDAVESGEINWGDFYRPNLNKKPEEIPSDNTSVSEQVIPSTDVSSATQLKEQKVEVALQDRQKSLDEAKQKLVSSFPKSVKWEAEKALKENNIQELERLASLGAIPESALMDYKRLSSSVKKIEGALAGLSNPPVIDSKPASEQGIFSNISAITPIPTQEEGYSLPPVKVPEQAQYAYPESLGKAVVGGETLETVPVSGAEGIPIRKAIPVEVPLPEAAPSETLIAEPIQETEEEYRYRAESSLTGRPFKSAADARMAKKILEQQLGVKATIDIEKGEKGTRLHYVRITEDEPSPMEKVPKGMVLKQVTNKDGTVTTTYVPAVPVEQQVKTVEVGIDRAKTLKKAISEIRGIIGGVSPGVGGMANLLSKLPFPTDASTVESLNETIKGIIGFQELVDLKAAGGSLGALSDAELKMLTSLQGSLDVKNLHKEKYLKVLEDIEKRATDVQNKLEAHEKNLLKTEKQTNFQPIQENAPILIKSQEEWSKLKSGQRYNFNGDLGTKK
jgi:hypothetical protein